MKTEKKSQRFLGLFLLALLLSSGFLFSFKISPVKADDYFGVISTGFETGDPSFDVVTATISSDVSHSGNKSLKCVGNAKYAEEDFTGKLSFTAIFWWYQNNQDASTSPNIACIGDGAGHYITFMADSFTDKIGVRFSSTANNILATYAFGLHEWNKLKIYAEADGAGNVAVKVWANSTLIHDIASQAASMNTISKFDVGEVTSWQSAAITTYIDDVSAFSGDLVSADLEPDDTGPDWVFTDWRYYTFTVNIPSGMYSGSLDHVYIGFTEILTSNGTVGFAAWSNGSGWDSSTNMAYETRDLEPIRVKAGSWSSDGSGTTVTFPLWFTSSCLDIWLEENAVDVLVWFNDTTGAESGWLTVADDYFRIYTDGGFSRVAEYTGDAGVLPGGRDFNMYAYNNSYVFKDLYWRDLQHVKMVPEIQFRAGYQYFQLNWGVDYVLKDGSYQSGLFLQIEPDAVSYTGVFASNVWINYTANWYANNTLVKSEDLYSFYHGEVYNAGDYGRVKFFIDFWFDSGNASSLQGGRINAYEFPMQDSSALWLRWLSSSWGVKDDVIKQSECMMPIIQYGVAEGINSENIEFVRVWSSLAVPADEYDQYVAVINYDTFDTTLSPEPTLKGIMTPPWDETKMPVVANTGVLGAIWSMFAGIGKWLADNIIFGGLSLWPIFVAFLDTIAGWLGFPNAFSNFITWAGTGWTWLVNSFTYALTLVYNFFLFIGSVIVAILTVFAEAIVSFVNMLGMVSQMLGGTIAGGANLWETFGLTTWITVGIIFYPLYLVILWDEKGMDALVAHLQMVAGILLWLKDFFLRIITFVLDLIGRIIESIPVAE